MLPGAIAQYLADDASVTTHLATYDFGEGDAPAVFTIDPIPADCALPAVVVTQVGGMRWGTFAQKGQEALCDVRVWGDKDRSDAVLAAAAHAIWKSLERGEITWAGHEVLKLLADPPGKLSDTDGFPGYLIRVRGQVLVN